MAISNLSQIWAGLIPVLVSITIWMNYKRSKHGWLLGAVVQAVQVTFGILTEHWALVGCIVPMIVFLIAWSGAVKSGAVKSGPTAPVEKSEITE